MIRSLLVATVLLFGACNSSSVPSEDKPVVDEARAIAQCHNIAEKLDLLGFDREHPQCHLRVLDTWFTEANMAWVAGVASPSLDGEQVEGLQDVAVGCLFSFHVNAHTYEIVDIANSYASRLVDEEDTPRRTLSEEDAAKKAETYLAQISLPTRKLKRGGVWFDQGRSSSPNAWRVTFYRTHNGYRFEGDYINVCFHEKYGLLGYFKRFFSTPGPSEVRVEAENAEERARAALDRLLTEANVDPEEEALNILLRERETVYVNPFEFPQKSERASRFKHEEAALAHSFTFVVTAYETKPDVKPKWTATIGVYIDATTGEYLCANSNL